jgi:hypothetical protein
MNCRRCSECVGEDHHALLEEYDDETGECFVPCKHCNVRMSGDDYDAVAEGERAYQASMWRVPSAAKEGR